MFDPTGCQGKNGWAQLPYIADQVDADRRMKAGQEQMLCVVCLRWRWNDRRCADFKEADDANDLKKNRTIANHS